MDLFAEDDSPKQKRQRPQRISGFFPKEQPNDPPLKMTSTRKNKKKPGELTPALVPESQMSMVAQNHKLKVKRDTFEDDTDVETLVQALFAKESQAEVAKAIVEEDDDGNVEYKLKLVDTSRERIQQLTSQMKFRIKEGNGEAFYKIGFEDNGNPLGLGQAELKQSLNSLCHISGELRLELIVQKAMKGQVGMVVEVAVRDIRESVKSEMKVILMGESGSGKTTLVGS
jgi:ABC-type glutathione transport system ATPase component